MLGTSGVFRKLLMWVCPIPECTIPVMYMLRAMTKPALMTFNNIEAINFYFNAKLTDFAMFSYRFKSYIFG